MEVKVSSAGSEPCAEEASLAAVAVRPLRIWDWKRVRDLLRATYPTLDPQWLATELRTAGHRFAVALSEGRIVGCVRMDIRPETHVAELDLLAVEAGLPVQQVTTALVRYVDEVSMACGARQMTVQSLMDDTGVESLLRSCGFRACRPARAAALSHPPTGKPLLLWTRRPQALPLPDWQLRHKHAPRVPMGPFMRAAQAALYGVWVADFGNRTAS